ncbi:MAG: glucoamylase family protein [Planctomycetota bacterium]
MFVIKAFAVLLLTPFICRAPACADDVGPAQKHDTGYKFTKADEALLEEIQFATFQYFWKEVGSPAQLVKDRKKAPVASIAAVGFQLSAIPIGVEHGWISRDEGEKRALTVLRALIPRQDNKKFGIYLHYPDFDTAGLSHAGYEILASTVDHALFLAGAITAAEYFDGEVKRLVDRVIAESNWQAFAVGPNGFLSMGWKPDDPKDLTGSGRFLDHHWHLASDEERLTYFLAIGAPRSEHAIDPALYYRLKREVRGHEDMPPYVVSWPGALFTYVFAHCWIDYRSLGLDDPSRFGIEGARVDWFENSRRATLTHRQRCLEQAGRFKTFAPDRWGLSACAGRDGYLVPQVQPNLSQQDEWFEGTVAPYAAGSAIMFTPEESLAALLAFRHLTNSQNSLVVWRDPSKGGYGFVDSFNLDQQFASDDYVGIDQGPLLLGIENARTGLIWKLFMRHEAAQRSLRRLRLEP